MAMTSQPDFLVDTDEDGTITVTLARGNQPSLVISSDADGQQDAFVRQYGERGQMFINALQQRAETMTRTMHAIVKLQKSFFQTGDETQLRPMKLDDVAEQSNEGEDVTARQVMAALRRIIEQEDKQQPLSDERLMQMLQADGFNIARRTVAKYRELMGIPVARMRKK